MANVTAVSTPTQVDPRLTAATGITKTGTDTNGFAVNVTEQGTDAVGNILVVLQVTGKMDSMTAALGVAQVGSFVPAVITTSSGSKSNSQTAYFICTLGGYKDGANWTLKANVTGTGGAVYTWTKGKGGAGV